MKTHAQLIRDASAKRELETTRNENLLAAAVACALVLMTGCGSLWTRQPVAAALVEQAQIPGLPGVRMFLHPLQVDLAQIDHSPTNANRRAAGRDRPEFDIVTGISTGALIGPSAFLGQTCDAELKQNYTTISDKDIFKKRGLFAILKARHGLTSSAPLAKLIAKQLITDYRVPR